MCSVAWSTRVSTTTSDHFAGRERAWIINEKPRHHQDVGAFRCKQDFYRGGLGQAGFILSCLMNSLLTEVPDLTAKVQLRAMVILAILALGSRVP